MSWMQRWVLGGAVAFLALGGSPLILWAQDGDAGTIAIPTVPNSGGAMPLALLFTDSDGDGYYDRVGEQVSAIGVLTSFVSTANAGVRIQDATRGAVVLGAGTFDVGLNDLLQVWGTISTARYLPLILADSIRVVGGVPAMAPFEVPVTDILAGAYPGVKVRVRGDLLMTPDGPEHALLVTETGSIPITFQDTFERSGEFDGAIQRPRQATLVGFPIPAAYGTRMSVDQRADIELAPLPPYGRIALGALLAIIGIVAVSLVWRHRRVVRRGYQQEEFIARLEATTRTLEASRAEVSLSEARYRSLVENSPFGLFLSDSEGRILDANPSLVEMLAYESGQEIVGQTVESLHIEPGSWREFADGILATNGPEAVDAVWHRRVGGPLRVRVGLRVVPGRSGEASLIEGYVENVQERQTLEDQLRQAQKMEAVGRLAGGVAHDFNNLLTVVLTSSEFLLEDVPEGDPRRDEVLQIRDAGTRAASLTQQLLAFSRKQPLMPKVVAVNEVVRDALKLVSRLVEESVEVRSVLREDAGHVEVDPSQLQQVLMNLVLNARDAMPYGGLLTIGTGCIHVSGDAPSEREEIVPGEYVTLTVSDTGIGMNEETQRHLFEPFFTTKELGRGTGLGLATVYGIVKQSRGYIYARSDEGRGSTFTIYLPLASASHRPSGIQGDGPPESDRGSGMVLLVEDQVQVRTLVRRALAWGGYDCIEAADGREAVELLERYPGTLDAVVTDVVMPNMSGTELAERLRVLRPGLPVLFMSGYADDFVFEGRHLEDNQAFLRKPFAPKDIIKALRRLLARAGTVEAVTRGPTEA